MCISSRLRDVTEKEQRAPPETKFEGHMKRGSGNGPGHESLQWRIQLFLFGSILPHTSHCNGISSPSIL